MIPGFDHRIEHHNRLPFFREFMGVLENGVELGGITSYTIKFLSFHYRAHRQYRRRAGHYIAPSPSFHRRAYRKYYVSGVYF